MSNAKKARPGITLNLDRPRQLRLDLGALCRIEQKTGKKIHELVNFESMGASEAALILWGAMLRDDPDLTLNQVYDLFDMQAIKANLKELKLLIGALVEESFVRPDAEEEGEPQKKTRKGLTG